MPRALRTDKNEGFGGQVALSTAISDSTRQGYSLVLTRPLSRWTVSAVTAASTAATLVLRGSASTSTGVEMAEIMSFTAATSGVTMFSTGAAGYACKQVRLDVDAVSSSGGIDAWIAGAP